MYSICIDTKCGEIQEAGIDVFVKKHFKGQVNDL